MVTCMGNGDKTVSVLASLIGGEGDGKQPRSSFLTSPPGLLFQEEHWASRPSLAQLLSDFACVASVEVNRVARRPECIHSPKTGRRLPFRRR